MRQGMQDFEAESSSVKLAIRLFSKVSEGVGTLYLNFSDSIMDEKYKK
jgi:hypothetical protein